MPCLLLGQLATDQNWIGKGIGTGLLVQYWDPDKAEGYFHASWGWIIFVVSLLLLYGFHTLINSTWPDREANL